jgi:hypothetical protein
MWPDVHELGQDERFAAPGFTLPNGSPAEPFSSDNPATIRRHLEWMHYCGIDGVYLQHFLLDMPDAPNSIRYESRRRGKFL